MPKSKFNNEEEESGGDDWILTYGDLMTQLVCFFVLLISFSSINAAKLQQALMSIQEALGGSGAGVLTAMPSAIEDLPKSSQYDINDQRLIELESKISEYIERQKLSDHVETKMTKEGLVITLNQKEKSVFFDSADAKIKEEAYPILNEIGKLISNLPNNVRIEGHTDIRPINTAQFPSNWELSTMRATNVLRYLSSNSNIASKRFSAAGYGPYRPIAPNDTQANMAKNRRVEIIILNSKVDDKTTNQSDNNKIIFNDPIKNIEITDQY